MSLKIVYGRSGTGKSTYIFQEIAQKIKEKRRNGSNFKKVYIITPEQFSFTAEKKLLDTIENSAVIDAEVLTFNRMAYRVLNETRRANMNHLSSCGKSMLIYHLLAEQKKDLKFIGKSSENVELISTQITEFKKHGITIEGLKEVEQSSEDKYLKSKLQDMIRIYEAYCQEMQENYIDENDILTILACELENVNDFKDCDIYIDEFVGFTKQEYEILRVLARNNNIILTVCTDSIDLSENPDTDIFYSNKQTLNKVFEIAKEEKIQIEEPVLLENQYRFKNKELHHLEENIYTIPYRKYNDAVKNIELFLAKNQYSEIEKVGEEIIKLVRDKKYRYRDISVITKNTEEYASLCKSIFSKYGIPVFIDEKKDLSQNILVRYILAILNIFSKNWTYEAMFEYIKTDFLGIESIDVNILENYCLKWGIKGKKWYDGEWAFYEETDEEKEKILHIRELIVPKLLALRKELSGRKTVKQITEKLYTFLIENAVKQKLEEKIMQLNEIGQLEKAKEYETSWKIVMDILNEIVFILGEKEVTFEKYAEILKVGLGNSGLGKIPGTQDQITVGDVDRSRSHKVKAVFIIGLNDGVFPSVNKNEGFFNDNDREKLKENGVELAKGTIEKLYDDNFNIYKAFSTAEERIYLSYVSANLEGKSLRPSMLVNRIKRIFPNMIEQSDVIEKQSQVVTKETTFEELLTRLRSMLDGDEMQRNRQEISLWMEVYQYYANDDQWKEKLENSLKALKYTNHPENISRESIQKLYGETLKTSISRLEQYRSCPFSYYLKYGLNLSDKNEFKIEAIDTGTFMHDIIDEFFEIVEQRRISILNISDEEIGKIIDEIVSEKLQLKKNYIFTSIPKYRVLANRLIRVIKKSMKYIVDSIRYSKFEVLGHELEFKQGKEYPPIQFTLEDGRKVELTGKIDRIDIAKNIDGNYIRIIDYKSSVKDINLNEVVAGLQLQLLTYLDAVCENDKFLPAGVLYFNLIDPLVKANSHMTDEQIEEEIRKQFKMKGLILADIDIVKMMDTKIEKGSSNIIPAYIDKDGNLGGKSSSITRKQFESLQKYIKNTIKQISKEILSGNIDVKPYYKVKGGKTPCDYCKYKTICNFNNGICKDYYYYVGNINKDAILDEISQKRD